ncbi:MAG: hypothetical protein BA869_12365 [Desulfuromonadales bacterium C00003107]|jgi:uncharacterized protein YhaN|nr:MAG: hypothetical protein BA869_12365 [Desulfuromonadales bacterium C00003107]
MILRSLELKHFGKFGERSFDFRRGFNLVIGSNESGKSTMMEAIPAALFGLRDKDRYKSWGRQGSCEAALALENGGCTVRIERELISDRVQLIERDDLYQVLYQFDGKAAPQGRSSERAEYLDQLNRLLAVADEDIFRSSLFFGQGDLELADRNGLTTRLKALLSGFVEVDYDRVLTSLSDDYFNITRKNPWGKDKTRPRQLDELSERIEVLQQRWFAAEQGLKELASLREQIAELSESMEKNRADQISGERYLDWVRKQWQLEEKEGSLRKDYGRIHRESGKVEELEKRRADLENELVKTGLPREMPEELPPLLSEGESIRKDMVTLQAETSALQQELAQQANPARKRPALITVAAVLISLLAGLFGGAFKLPLWGLAGLVTAAFWGLHLWRCFNLGGQRKDLQEQLQIVERRRDEARDRRIDLSNRLEVRGLSTSPVELVRMQKNLESHQHLLGQIREVESALQVLDNSEHLSEEKDHLTRELAVLGERMEQDKPLRQEELLSAEELPQAEEQLQQLRETIRQNEQQLLDLTRREAALQGELSNLQQIEEEGEQLKEREAALLQQRDALAVAYQLLSEAVDEFRRTYLERFAAEIGRYLGLLTAGRYQKVRLADDFSLSLPGRGKDWRPVESYSRGTNDAVYFAVRLALTRQLANGMPLPLLLDDPLVNLDQQRLAEALNVLERLSREHQIILFSHDERLLKRATRDRWNVVTLDDQGRSTATVAQEGRNDGKQLSFL